MEESLDYKFKICLVGESAVGKTSLIKRFVYDQFKEKYLATIGTKISKKELMIISPDHDELINVYLLVWDIMGQQGFRQLLKEAYFYGANGIIGVCDITKKETLTSLNGWMEMVQDCVGTIPAVILGNKCDLENDQQMGLDEVRNFASHYDNTKAFLTSARTGSNVESAFRTLSEMILKDML